MEQSSDACSQLVKKFLNFVKTEVSLPVRKTAASPNPEQDKSFARPFSEFFNMHFNVTLPSAPRYLKLPINSIQTQWISELRGCTVHQ